MKTGFFDLSKLSDEQLKIFFKEALLLSYDASVQIKGHNNTYRRELCNFKTFKDMTDIISHKHHNVCVDRKIQHPQGDLQGEIGFSTFDNPSYFLYLYINNQNLYYLIDKYKLKEKLI